MVSKLPLERRVFALLRRGPITAPEIAVALDESEDEVREACEQLRLKGSAWVMFGWRYAA